MINIRFLMTFLIGLILSLSTTSCNAKKIYNDTYSNNSQKLELGTIQKGIYEGMAQDEVVQVLGAPNIVTADKDKKETWVYDKIATESRKSGCSGLTLFFQTGADYVSRSDVSQKTLTLIIKFDREKNVETVSYHSSKF